MIACIIMVGFAFIWLGYETDWMRVRLLAGPKRRYMLPPPTLIEKVKRKWQFAKYGEDCIMTLEGCHIMSCRLCRQGERFFAWKIPARTVKILYPITRPKGGTRKVVSTINFKAGCNLYRAKLLKDIVKAQKSKAVPSYKQLPETNYYKNTRKQTYTSLYGEPSIELLVDGKSIANINGDYKRGMIKKALNPYTTKIKVGRQSVTCGFGKADIAPQ